MVWWLPKALKRKELSDNKREHPLLPSIASESPYVDVSSVYLEEP
jgi:hypothetical protein